MEHQQRYLDTSSSDLFERLAELTARLDEQAARIERQEAEIVRLRAASPISAAVNAPASQDTKLKRRGMLARVMGATAAAALLSVAKDAATARADTGTTLWPSGASTSEIGLVATYGAGANPYFFLPPLNFTVHSIIGTYGANGPTPLFDSGVTGLGSDNAGFVGVQGLSKDNYGIYGRSTQTAGIRGDTLANSGAGVWGTASVGLGVLGQTSTGAGVFGDSFAAGGYGVFGRSTNGAAIFGTTTNGYAGSFNGRVIINGDFSATGVKSAVVPHRDGMHRRVYCQESPEPWFEDFGRGKLVGGKADVKLDPEFAAVVKTDDYLVFLTEVGDSGGLFISAQSASSFSVQARVAKTTGIGRTDAGDGAFTYRIVARRKDIAGKRLEKVDLSDIAPKLNLPDPPTPTDGVPLPPRPARKSRD